MPRHGKNYRNAAKLVDSEKLYQPGDAVSLVKQTSFVKFDSTVELHFRLGVDPRHADQMVRGTAVLPHGTGKTVRILVFAQGDKAREAEQAGADFVGSADLVKQITVIIDGDKFTVKLDTDAIATGTIKLDPAKKPKHIDVTFLEGGQQGQTELGIYELTADSFKVCFLIGDDAAKKRPASFEADKDGTNMMVMQRQKK